MTSRGARRTHAAGKKPRRSPKRATSQTRPQVLPADEAEGLPPGIYLSVSQAAAEFGNDRRTVTKRIAELGIRPVDTRQGYPVYRLRDLLEMERRSATGETDPEKLNPFERVAYYKAESERLKINQERGELLRRDQVELEWARVVKLLALELDTLVDEVERDVGASPLVLEKIEQKIDSMRERAYAGIVAHYEEVQEPAEQVNGADAIPPAR